MKSKDIVPAEKSEESKAAEKSNDIVPAEAEKSEEKGPSEKCSPFLRQVSSTLSLRSGFPVGEPLMRNKVLLNKALLYILYRDYQLYIIYRFLTIYFSIGDDPEMLLIIHPKKRLQSP